MIRQLAIASLLFAGAAFAGTDVAVPSFSGINTHNGARVVLRHGSKQQVSVIYGDASKASIHVNGNTLDVRGCNSWCVEQQKFVVKVVSPRIDTIEAHDGGALDAEGDFPKQPTLNLSAHSGGAINSRAIQVETLRAKAYDGGAMRVTALVQIDAEASDGGAITYYGNPAQANVKSRAGGVISKK